MGSVGVVVVGVVDHEPFELLLVPDDGAGQPFGLFEELAADRSDPAFSERVWASPRLADGDYAACL